MWKIGEMKSVQRERTSGKVPLEKTLESRVSSGLMGMAMRVCVGGSKMHKATNWY